MFFTNESRKNLSGNERIGHVGIYFGNNYILHTASDHAVIEPISNTRWGYYITARRLVYLIWGALLGLCCCAWAFSSCSEWGLLFFVVCGLFTVEASLVVEHGL